MRWLVAVLVLLAVLTGCTGAPAPSEGLRGGELMDWTTGEFYCPQAAPGDAIPTCALPG